VCSSRSLHSAFRLAQSSRRSGRWTLTFQAGRCRTTVMADPSCLSQRDPLVYEKNGLGTRSKAFGAATLGIMLSAIGVKYCAVCCSHASISLTLVVAYGGREAWIRLNAARAASRWRYWRQSLYELLESLPERDTDGKVARVLPKRLLDHQSMLELYYRRDFSPQEHCGGRTWVPQNICLYPSSIHRQPYHTKAIEAQSRLSIFPGA